MAVAYTKQKLPNQCSPSCVYSEEYVKNGYNGIYIRNDCPDDSPIPINIIRTNLSTGAKTTEAYTLKKGQDLDISSNFEDIKLEIITPKQVHKPAARTTLRKMDKDNYFVEETIIEDDCGKCGFIKEGVQKGIPICGKCGGYMSSNLVKNSGRQIKGTNHVVHRYVGKCLKCKHVIEYEVKS